MAGDFLGPVHQLLVGDVASRRGLPYDELVGLAEFVLMDQLGELHSRGEDDPARPLPDPSMACRASPGLPMYSTGHASTQAASSTEI